LRLAAGDADGYLLAVADGMGGHAGGEVASEIAITTLREHVARIPTEDDPAPPTLASLLVDAFQVANARVLARAEEDPGLRGMGTTMVASLTIGEHTQIANVGDSRAYIVNHDGIRQPTVDHTWEALELERGKISPEEIAGSPFYGMIARSIGALPELDVDTFDVQLSEGDYLLLCSDGAYREVSDAQMHAVVAAERDPERCCRRLVDLANEAGGADNITCVLAGPAGEVAGERAADTLEIAVLSPKRRSASSKR
jgi:protein phosphatase